MKRIALVFGAFVAPLLVAVAACNVDGATPDCSQPNAACDPAAPNLNPDAHPFTDAKADAPASETGTGSDSAVDSGTDAADAKNDGDAKIGDAKTDGG